MTIEQFNKRYLISVHVTAVQTATLSKKQEDEQGGIDYHSIDEIMNTLDIAVYDKETHDEVFIYEGDDEAQFLEQLYEEFNIQE